MKQVTILFILFTFAAVLAVQKSAYDRSAPFLSKSNADEGVRSTESILPHNNILEMCMLTGGYFTIGTTDGKDSEFDDNCAVTFGHPYAVTSYPMLSIDGTLQKLDEWVMSSDLVPAWGDNELSLSTTIENIDIDWKIRLVDDQVDLHFSAINKDVSAHQLGAALVFDPALGQWGDGHLTMGSETVSQARTFRGKSVYNEFTLAERGTNPVGLSVGLDCNAHTPDELIATNWQNILAIEDASVKPVDVVELFDLCLKMIWEEQPIQPNESIDFNITLTYQQPEIPTPIYMRWDMPNALSIENGLLFPKKVTTTVRSMNWVRSNQSGLVIRAGYPSELSGTTETANFTVNALQSSWMDLNVQAKEIYEDRVVPVTLQCFRGDEMVDELERNIFIPAVPVSDEGLIVEIDSCFTDDFPVVDLFFHASEEETGVPLLNIAKDNVFFYENGNRIQNFTVGKSKLGGSNLADVCFVLDCSGSMGDEIKAVRNNLGEFADTLVARGLDYRIAAVTFSTTVDDVWDFTSNVEQMKQNLAGVQLWGGVEDSPAALWKASELSWRPNSQRNIIWITDEEYPETSHTKTAVVNRMLSLGISVHGVGLTSLQTDWFNPIVLPTGGSFFNINGNFRDILLAVSRMEAQSEYHLSYESGLGLSDITELKVKIHYAGLGGEAICNLNANTTTLEKPFVCYPNPFNPSVQIQVEPFSGKFGELDIFNMLGQRVKSFNLPHQAAGTIIWNADDDNGMQVSAGFYMVRLRTQSDDGTMSQHMQKILYLK